MKLVLLFFCGILIITILAIILILLSKIRINIKKCKVSNIEGNKHKKLEKNIEIYLELYLLGIIKIAKIKVKKEIFKKLKIKEDIKSLEKDVKVIKKAHPLEIIKKLKIKVGKAYLNLEIGIEDVVVTSYLVAIISTVIRYSICKY